MLSRNATAPESGVYRTEGRNDHSFGKRDRLAPQASKRPASLPPTAMADAFLDALVRLGARQPDLSTEIVIPTGTVDAGELVRVVLAIARIRHPGGQS